VEGFYGIRFKCPRCGQQIEFQNMPGNGEHCIYDLDNMPPYVMDEIVGHSEHCSNCNADVTLISRRVVLPMIVAKGEIS
jgi:ribosomal protein S27AE